MKTIKDILKSDSIEQRRRIANNLAINREDKNALIVNESNGGGKSKICYYRFDSNSVIEELKSLGYNDDIIIGFMYLYCKHANAYIYNDSGNDIKGVYYIGYTPHIISADVAHRIDGLLVFEDNYSGEYPYIIKGNLYTKVNFYLKFISKQAPEEAEMIKRVFDICLKYTTEITENEFWSMCDLPITPLPE